MTDFNAPAAAEKETDAPDGERDQPTDGSGPEREFTVESRSQSQMVFRRFLHHRLAMVCLVVLTIVVIFSLVGGRLWTYGYEEITDSFNTPPFRALDENGEMVWSAQHPMGTDTEGHDFMALILRGAQKSVQIMLVVAFLSTAIGIVYGAVSGYYSGRIDGVMMRILDVMFTIPLFAILIVLSRRIEASGSWLFVALLLGLLVWFSLARLVRAEFLSLREKEFVEAARALGAGDARIIFRHILPNTVGTIIVSATLTMATAILLETALSFLGLGIRAPDTSLGLLVSRYQAASSTRPWLFYIPGVFIVIIALCVNFVGDGLRDAVRPEAAKGAAVSDSGAEPKDAPDAEPADSTPLTAEEIEREVAAEGVVLAVENLSVDFPTEDGVVHAVRGVSYELRSGEVLGIVGESGSGKSVSCMAVMGLLPKSADIKGSVRYRGQELLRMPEKSFNRIRGAKIAMIFQDPMTSLNPVHRVGHQIAEGVRVHQDISEEAAVKRAAEMLDLVGIPNAKERVKNYPHEFSGGMRQRAMIAMAVANDPDIVIADEPTTALDVTVQAQVLEVLKAVRDEFNSAIILITHDLGVVAGMTDRLVVMYAGRQVEFGGVDEVYEHPRMPYTLGLIGALPRLDSDGSERLVPIKGSPPSLVNLPPGCPFQPRCPLARPLCNEVEPDLMPTDSIDHLAACHFWKELAGDVAAEDVFEVTAEDADLVAEVQAVQETVQEEAT